MCTPSNEYQFLIISLTLIFVEINTFSTPINDFSCFENLIWQVLRLALDVDLRSRLGRNKRRNLPKETFAFD